MPIVAVPSKRIPDVVVRLTDRYVAGRQNGESFKDFVKRIGKVELKKLLEDLTQPPEDLGDHSFFRDWGDPREYTLGDMGVGECAGEVVSSIEFELAAAERQLFEAQIAFENGEVEQSGRTAYQSMLRAARAVVKTELPGVDDDPEQIIGEFRTRFYDTKKFFDPYAGGKFAQYLFAAHEKAGSPHTADSARYLMDEAHLFIEASHNYSNRADALVAS